MSSSSHPLQDAIHEHSTQSEVEAALRDNHGDRGPAEGSIFGGNISGRKLPSVDGTVGTIGVSKLREQDRADLVHKLFGREADRDGFTRRERYWVAPTARSTSSSTETSSPPRNPSRWASRAGSSSTMRVSSS